MPPSKKEALVDAAMRVFSRHGFHASGLDKVLQEAGISRMTLYNHFKSKDELIVASLERRDELFRSGLIEFVEGKSEDPIERLDAVFDFIQGWCTSGEFSGCMFVNVAAEYPDADSPIRKVAAEHKLQIALYLRELCRRSGVSDPDALSEQLAILIEGAAVSSFLMCQGESSIPASHPVVVARSAAHVLIERALEAPAGHS